MKSSFLSYFFDSQCYSTSESIYIYDEMWASVGSKCNYLETNQVSINKVACCGARHVQLTFYPPPPLSTK